MMNRQHFKAAVRLGARYSNADLRLVDVEGITALAEEVVATVLTTSEETVRELVFNAIASPHHESWFEGELSDSWRESMLNHVAGYWKWDRGLDGYRPRLRLVQGGAQ